MKNSCTVCNVEFGGGVSGYTLAGAYCVETEVIAELKDKVIRDCGYTE